MMNPREFTNLRGKLHKTQKELSQLLGTSIKAVHSYEQGWRAIPGHVERQMFFLASRRLVDLKAKKSCWQITRCPRDHRSQCPAKEFKAYKLCWFICGTKCHGVVHDTWKEKMAVCRTCPVFQPVLDLAVTNE